MTQFNILDSSPIEAAALPYAAVTDLTPSRRGNVFRGLASLIAAGAVLAATAGCSDNSNQEADQTCYTQLSAPDAALVQQSLAANGATTNYNNANGTQDVCVIEGGEAHYYGPTDGFANYFIYETLASQTASFSDYEVINGGLPAYEQFALTNAVGVRSDGTVYSMFAPSAGEFTRRAYASGMGRMVLKQTQYGHSKPVSFSSTPANGYHFSSLRTADPNAVALTTKSGKVTPSTITKIINAPGVKLGAAKKAPPTTPTIPKLRVNKGSHK